MKKRTMFKFKTLRILVLAVVSGVIALGCSDDSHSDKEALSTDNIVLGDTDTASLSGTDALTTDSGQAMDTAVVVDTGTSSTLPVDTGSPVGQDSNTTTDTGIDSGIPVDTSVAVATDVDTTVDTATDTSIDTTVDTQEDTDTNACPFACRRQNFCNNNDGTIHEEFECEQAMVCCEMAETDSSEDSDAIDTETNAVETDSVDDTQCTAGCHPATWCNINDAVIYDELICSGNQICCEIVE